ASLFSNLLHPQKHLKRELFSRGIEPAVGEQRSPLLMAPLNPPADCEGTLRLAPRRWQGLLFGGLQHLRLQPQNTSARLLFADFSSAVNSLHPHILATKLSHLDDQLILWILDVLPS
ncbi:hypothetical protein M9458_026050, partial [Cirrhinus mrigala]